MKKRIRKSSHVLPLLMVQLGAASWETILRRSLMMAQGTCSAAEYRRMVSEKSAALQSSTVAFWSGKSHRAIVAPFLTRARRNARRLRR